MTCVKPQLENVPATSPLQANCGLGVLVGLGGFVGAFVGLGFGLVGLGVGLGVLVGGTDVKVAVGSGVLVGGIGVNVSVGGRGVLVGVGVSVGTGVLVGIGVCVGVRVTVKVGFGVLVGVAVSSTWRARNVRLPTATIPTTPHSNTAATMAITTTRITIRFLIPFTTPLDLLIRWSDTVMR
jgi:hypothetical protein